MESRALRFVDTTQDHHGDPRRYNEPNLHTGRRVPPGFYNVRNLLKEERQKNKLYNEVWKAAEKNVAMKRQVLGPKYFKENIANECYVAVIAYTMGLLSVNIHGDNHELYKDFNEKFRNLRGKSSWDYFPYKSFYYLLRCARHGIANQPNDKGRLYRGIRDVHISPKPKIGDDFYFHCFASCSQDFNTSKGFMGSDGTMIVLEDGAELAMNIAPYSAFKDYEVLVFPQNRFKIISFEKQGSIDVLKIRRAENKNGAVSVCAQLSNLAIAPKPSGSCPKKGKINKTKGGPCPSSNCALPVYPPLNCPPPNCDLPVYPQLNCPPFNYPALNCPPINFEMEMCFPPPVVPIPFSADCQQYDCYDIMPCQPYYPC